MKYQYHVQTWGGFYNDEYKAIHGLSAGDFVFDTKEERREFIEKLEAIAKKMQAYHLCTSLSEGFNCNTRTIAHRVCKINGKEYHDSCDLGVNYPYDTALYWMENKWYPGFNSYPLGEDFDYENAEIEIVAEWVEGAFTNKI